jgi:hypothetical protein
MKRDIKVNFLENTSLAIMLEVAPNLEDNEKKKNDNRVNNN